MTAGLLVIKEINKREDEIMKLEERTQIKGKENIVIRETIQYLIKNGFAIKNQDGSQFDMQKFLELHSHIFDKNHGTGNNINGEQIFLKVIDADHYDGFISFMPSNGCYVITDHSDHLSQYIYYVMCIMRKLD